MLATREATACELDVSRRRTRNCDLLMDDLVPKRRPRQIAAARNCRDPERGNHRHGDDAPAPCDCKHAHACDGEPEGRKRRGAPETVRDTPSEEPQPDE